MLGMHSSKRLRTEELHVDRTTQPNWPTGAEQTPEIGDIVMCAAGLAKVMRLRGKTGDGSRLLELQLVDGTSAPFYAAASNVLVQPA
jgi:hypothetical protein